MESFVLVVMGQGRVGPGIDHVCPGAARDRDGTRNSFSVPARSGRDRICPSHYRSTPQRSIAGVVGSYFLLRII
jgi:hypothetical protein